jgi:hypothetical protein
MIRSAVALLLITLFSSCRQTETIEGDLFFSFLRFGSFYGLPDKIVTDFKACIKIQNSKEGASVVKELRQKYKILEKEGLLYSPYIQMKFDNGSIVYVYMTSSDYDKVKIYKRQKLQDNHQKIRLKMESKKLDNKLFLCQKLLDVKKVAGKTFSKQLKFKIEDYN